MIRRFLLILLLTSTAFAETKVKHHSGCPLDFRVPKGWSVDQGKNCSYSIISTNPMRMIDFHGYTGTRAELEPRYRQIEKDTPRREVSFGDFRGLESLKGRAYIVISNDDLLVEMQSMLAPAEVVQSIAASIRATGSSSQNKKHQKLFPRACGVKLDYPRGWFADHGHSKESRCEAVLRSAVPPRVNASSDVNLVVVRKKAAPLSVCASQQELDAHRAQVFAGTGWVAASLPAVDRADDESVRQFIVSDGCERTLIINNATETLQNLVLQTIQFHKTDCTNRVTKFPVCFVN